MATMRLAVVVVGGVVLAVVGDADTGRGVERVALVAPAVRAAFEVAAAFADDAARDAEAMVVEGVEVEA